jgi:hypothetical protein
VTRRLRAAAERPLDPATGRIVAILGGAVCVGFAALGATGSPRSSARPAHAGVPAVAPPLRRTSVPGPSTRSARGRRTQDPQDRPGSPAARRADRELDAHRALQHVPWRHAGASIDLVGARGPKAVLEVRAASIDDARRGYWAFLRHFHDGGRAYLPRFRARGGHRGR